MDGFLSAEGFEDLLLAELQECVPGEAFSRGPHGMVLREGSLGFTTPLPCVAFSRQCLPNAQQVQAPSVNTWAREICQRVKDLAPEGGWVLHVTPHYSMPTGTSIDTGARALHTQLRHSKGAREISRRPGTPSLTARPGAHRCELILHEVREHLQRFSRSALRRLSTQPGTFRIDQSLVQAVLTSPETGFISVAQSPIPFLNRHVISHFPQGHVHIPGAPLAPSRAFAKLIEAQARLGHEIRPGETCVDLGAAPGSWTYVAAQAGASVIAVDRSALRADLMQHPRIRFLQADAFEFRPRKPVDWLLCDVIADPARLTDLLVRWLQQRWCRAFVFTIKLRMAAPADALAVLRTIKSRVPPLCHNFMLTRLESNKHEICAFGRLLAG